MLASFAIVCQSLKFGFAIYFRSRDRHVDHIIMSLYRWFTSASSKAYLPDPALEQTKERKLEIANANARVVEAMETRPQRRKRSGTTYSYYSPELRAKIGKFAAESGSRIS